MKILNTRPKERLEPLSSKLIAKGHDVIPFPLLELIPLEFAPFNVQDYDGIITTSPFSQTIAIQSGAQNIYAIDEHHTCVDDLTKDLVKGRFLYLRGEHVSNELEDIPHDTRIVYTSKPTSTFPQTFEFDAAVLFSKRTAEVFEAFYSGPAEIYALSPQIANGLKGRYKKIHIPKTPTLEGLLELF